MSDIKVLGLLGSLRAASINRQLAELAVETAPEGVSLRLFDRLGELPFYNEDIDNENVAEPVVALRAAAADADAALVVTP
jgi:NAD(P)H-dependent FMN reductase